MRPSGETKALLAELPTLDPSQRLEERNRFSAALHIDPHEGPKLR